MEAAAAKEEQVWPDGNEKSIGWSIKVLYPSLTVNGRGRRITFFKTIFPRKALKNNDQKVAYTALEFTLEKNIIPVIRNQMNPKFPEMESTGITILPTRVRTHKHLRTRFG